VQVILLTKYVNMTTTFSTSLEHSTSDRRISQRLDIRLPIEVGIPHPPTASLHAVTRNVSASGVYFEAPATELNAGHDISVELTVPPGEGYFPYAGRVRGNAEVIRVDCLTHHAGPARMGVAARFRDPLKLVF